MIRALEILMVNLGSISEAASQMGLRPYFTISEKKTLTTVFPPISVFLAVYPSQWVPYTVSQQGSSFLRTVNLVFFYLT